MARVRSYETQPYVGTRHTLSRTHPVVQAGRRRHENVDAREVLWPLALKCARRERSLYTNANGVILGRRHERHPPRVSL